MGVAIFFRFGQQDQIHGSDSQTEAQELHDIDAGTLMLEQVSPDVGRDEHEVASNEDQDVIDGCFIELPDSQTYDGSDQAGGADE